MLSTLGVTSLVDMQEVHPKYSTSFVVFWLDLFVTQIGQHVPEGSTHLAFSHFQTHVCLIIHRALSWDLEVNPPLSPASKKMPVKGRETPSVTPTDRTTSQNFNAGDLVNLRLTASRLAKGANEAAIYPERQGLAAPWEPVSNFPSPDLPTPVLCSTLIMPSPYPQHLNCE